MNAVPVPTWQRSQLAPILAVLVIVCFSAALLVFIDRNCYFFGDDYSAFWVATQHSLWQALWLPVGAQVAPLARAVTEALFACFRVNYVAARLVLGLFYLSSILSLTRVLRLLGTGRFTLLVLVFYCSYLHLWVHLAWWSSGIHRLPFVALALASLDSFLRYRTSGARHYLLLACVLDLLALGFYVKAVFLPLLLVAVDACRSDQSLRTLWKTPNARRAWLVCLALLAFNLLYSIVTQRLFGHAQPPARLDPVYQAHFVAKNLLVFAHSLFAIGVFPNQSFHAFVPALWAAAFVASLLLAPRTFFVWCALLALLALNMLVVGLSNRVGLWGELMVYEARYFYELHFFVLIFLVLIARQCACERGLERAVGAARVLEPVLLALAAVHALASYYSVSTTAFSISDALPKNRAYMLNLDHDLETLKAAGTPLVLADGQLPSFVYGLDLTFRQHSQLFTVIGVQARFVPDAQAELRVGTDGHIVPAR